MPTSRVAIASNRVSVPLLTWLCSLLAVTDSTQALAPGMHGHALHDDLARGTGVQIAEGAADVAARHRTVAGAGHCREEVETRLEGHGIEDHFPRCARPGRGDGVAKLDRVAGVEACG